MDKILQLFESIARRAHRFSEVDYRVLLAEHPFEKRNIHQDLPSVVRDLFDNGHYAQATFEAFKYVDKLVQTIASSTESGFKCMMQAFSESAPQVHLTPNRTTSDKDEQKGYQFLFAGSMLAIRNPRGHEFSVKDSPDICLDHLALTSLLLRRLEQAGYSVKRA
jgi:uncharacterized protein (TIGR02391 family)